MDLNQVDGATYTRSFDWTNPWGHGESWTRGIQAYWAALPPERRNPLPAVLRQAIETFEREILDPDTGMPSRGMPQEDGPRAMAGLFKTMRAHLTVGRPVPYARQATDYALSLQRDDGEFGYARNMGTNWDALWVLRELDDQLRGAYRRADIVAAAGRLCDILLQIYRKKDGGFAFQGETCLTVHHSIRLMHEPRPVSDMLGTIMCLQCLAYYDEWTGAGPQWRSP